MSVAQCVVCGWLSEGTLRGCGTGFLVVRKRLFRIAKEAFLRCGIGFSGWRNGLYGMAERCLRSLRNVRTACRNGMYGVWKVFLRCPESVVREGWRGFYVGVLT